MTPVDTLNFMNAGESCKRGIVYHGVTSVDAHTQSKGICEYFITFFSRKDVFNRLVCF